MMDFLTQDFVVAVLVALLGTKAVAMAIVNATDTPADDRIVGKVYKVIEAVAGIVAPGRAKQFPGEVELPDLSDENQKG